MSMIVLTFLEELKTKKVFVKHVETVTSSEVTFEVLQSFVVSSVVSLASSCTKILAVTTYDC